MKIRISKRTRRIIAVYLAILFILYVVIYHVPHLTNSFETTQVLENGTLEVSCEAEGYIVKDESVSLASVTGNITYPVEDGTVVKKGTTVAQIEAASAEEQEKSKVKRKYDDYMERLGGYELVTATNEAPISGTFSRSIDGYEKYFSPANLDNITREGAEETSPSQLDLAREKVNKGEPIFKISSDKNWYIVSWVEEADAKTFEQDEKVRITIEEDTMDAKVYSINKEGEFYKVVFSLNVYYEQFCSARQVSMSVVQSNTVGLIVDNECIIEKEGVKGVYVKTKDGDTYFKPIKIKITDGEQSVIYESIFVNDDYEQVETVRVYQEVLRNPQEALEKDMAEN